MSFEMKNHKIFLLIFTLPLYLFLGFYSYEDENCRKIPNQMNRSQVNTYYLNINNIEVPLNGKGKLADVIVPPYTSGAKFIGLPVIFFGVSITM